MWKLEILNSVQSQVTSVWRMLRGYLKYPLPRMITNDAYLETMNVCMAVEKYTSIRLDPSFCL